MTGGARLETWQRPKDQDELLDYVFDYSLDLDSGDTIQTYTLTVSKGHCTVSTSSNDTETVTAWFAGGQDGEVCEITNRVVTQAGRIIERTARLLIRRR